MMTIVLIALASHLFVASESKGDVAKLTPTCPASEFVVGFAPSNADLESDDLETIDAAVNRARQCDVAPVVIYTEGAPTVVNALRIGAVSQALEQRGIEPSVIRRELRPKPADAAEASLNQVTVQIGFR